LHPHNKETAIDFAKYVQKELNELVNKAG